MADYTAPLDDIRFVLDRIASLGELSSLEGFGHAEPDVVHGILDECARFMQDKVAPLNRVGDVETSVWHAEDNRVTTPTRSEEHTSELQSLMLNSYAVFGLKKKIQNTHT